MPKKKMRKPEHFRTSGRFLLSLLIAAVLFCTACTGSGSPAETKEAAAADQVSQRDGYAAPDTKELLREIPLYSGSPSVVVNDNRPYFTEEEKTTDVFETYSDLDGLGRCGTAYANICLELMPTEKRGDISDIHPTGWHSSQYDFIDEDSLYNRCHLIAHELAGEDANEKNLITGTRYFNVEGMEPYENMVAEYVKETNHHVLYRVTPVFEGDNLVADGVLMEAFSVEDDGESICYCVYCYNVQPGVTIDYATGDNWPEGEAEAAQNTERDYILNTNTMKFHLPDCEGVPDISEKNKKEYTGSRADLIAGGYSPCGLCHP